MRNHSRARRLALTALWAGTSLGAVGLAGQASAATTTACSNLWASGSTLQTPSQQNTFTQDAGPDGAFKNCTSAPSVYYNETASMTPYPGGGVGSGAGLTEFALAGSSPALTPTESSNQSWLDGFIGSDAAPNSAAISGAESAAGTDPETIPVLQAPVAVVVNLPTGCTISAVPKVTNDDLIAAWENNITWQTLLTDAKAKPKGTCSSVPTLEARSDNSGTTFAFREYLNQLDPSVYTSAQVSTSSSAWPSSVTVSESYGDGTPNQGSGGESAAVANTPGSIGYVNAADAHADNGFSNWAAGSSTFWLQIQNNGTSTTSVTAAGPATGTNAGNCYSAYTGTVPSGNAPDWSSTFVANPKQKSTSAYPICTLTYDIAWESYVSDPTLAAYYNGNYGGETPAGVEASTRDYLTWLAGGAAKQGQTVVPSYYTKLPATIEKAAATTVKDYVGIN